MRKCLDCNAELDDIEMKCSACGSKNLSEIIIHETERKPISKKKLIALISAGVAVIIAVGLIIGGAFAVIRNTQIDPVVSGVKAIMSGDVEGYISEFDEAFQDTIRSAMLTDTTAEDYQQEQQDALTEFYGDDYKIYVDAVSVKDANEKVVESFNYSYSDYEVTATDIKHVTVTIFITGSSGETMDSRTMYAVKINNEWSLFQDFTTSSEETATTEQ